jgi:hypothetical protein
MSGTINANATIAATYAGNGVYDYTITLNNTGSISVGTFWFSWVPGDDFMSTNPTEIGAPAGWAGNVTSNPFAGGTGYAIQWVNNSGQNIAAGASSSAFTFASTETPEQMAANSPFVSGTPTTTSFLYQGGPFSGASLEFVPTVNLIENAVGTLTATAAGGGAFNYTVQLTDTGNTPVGTFWFAWDDVPDQDFMNQQPTNVGDPAGWSHNITTHVYPGGTGYGIEWIAQSGSVDLTPGQTNASFTFTSTETPAQMAAIAAFQATSTIFPTTSSFVYSGAALATPGGNFVVQVACYREGTRIRTPSGDVAIETLRPGDRVVTAFGDIRPIVWSGVRRIDCAGARHPHLSWPVRVAAGALGDGLPARDLWLSPDHALWFDDVLIPVKHLINHRGIAGVPLDTVTWHHLELENHDVILAEGAPAESYLRAGAGDDFFGEGPVVPLHSLIRREANSRFPLVVTGPVLAAVRRRLNRLASSQEFIRAA